MAFTPFTPVRLLNPGEPSFSHYWVEFFYNPEQVRLVLTESDSDLVTAIITAGCTWDEAGWNTTKATARLFALTKVTMVSRSLNK